MKRELFIFVLLSVFCCGCNDLKVDKLDLVYTVNKDLSSYLTLNFIDIGSKSESLQEQHAEMQKLYSMSKEDIIREFIFEDKSGNLEQYYFKNKTQTKCDLTFKSKNDFVLCLLPIFHRDGNFAISKNENVFSVLINKKAISYDEPFERTNIVIKFICKGKVLTNNAHRYKYINEEYIMEWDFNYLKEDGVMFEMECSIPK
jgi:hypothetical protein